MSEEKPEGLRGTIKGWIKAAVTSVVGLISGAFIMYLTPVVNNVIKPAKPLANFATHVTGLSVDFNNRSTGGTQGWWDFGDGTALEPFDPKLETVKHVYAKPATYSVKLSLQNLIGDESDRTVPVTLDENSAPMPEISQFDLQPFTRGETVPAVYRLKCNIKGASHCILYLGDERPMEIADASTLKDRYISYDQAGAFTVRVAAVNGKQSVEETKDLTIGGNSGTEPTAKLTVSYDAIQVVRTPKDLHVHCAWQAGVTGDVAPVRKGAPPIRAAISPCAVLVNADDPNAPIRNLKLEIAADKKKFILTGELVRSGDYLASNALPPHFLANVKVVMERRLPVQTVERGDISMEVGFNKTTKFPMQPLEDGWEIVGKHVNLQLFDGNKQVWTGGQAVTKAPVTLKKQLCYMTTLPQDDGFLVTIEAPAAPVPTPVLPPIATPTPVLPPTPVTTTPQPRVGPYIRPVSFERNPLQQILPKGN